MSSEHAGARQSVAALFDQVADVYDTVDVPWFRPIAARLVAEIGPVAGERALDIGCGRGAALFPLADAVGTAGHVLGIDLAAQMVDRTGRAIADRGLGHIELRVMDASAPDLAESSYDLITASLVLFFLPDPATALRAWRALLRPGGRLGVSTFGEQDPRWEAIDEIFVPYLPPRLLDARTSGSTGPFGSDDALAELVAAAGFDNVRTVGFELTADFSDVETWHRWSWSHGQRAMWLSVPEPERAAVRDAAYGLLEGCRDADGRILLSQGIRLTLAHR